MIRPVEKGASESHLILLSEGASAEERLWSAEQGLEQEGLEAEMCLLLLRQRYRARLELGNLEAALNDAHAMTELAVTTGQLRAVAHHDAARVLQALGRLDEAIGQQTKAVHTAMPSAKSFHYWCLATLQHAVGNFDAAILSLDRALRTAGKDRLLLETHRAHLILERGQVPKGLESLLRRLKGSSAQGYTRYLRGMIAHRMGDHHTARVFLEGWLNRHKNADRAKALTLAAELARAKSVLSKLGVTA